MGASLLTKSGAYTTSQQMAAFFNRALMDGVLTGCECNATSGGLTVTSGVMMLSGFMVSIDSQTFAPATSGEIVVKINIADGTADILTRPVADLVKEDLFNGGDEYEAQLATYTVSGSSITAALRTLSAATANSGITVSSIEPVNPVKGDIWIVTN